MLSVYILGKNERQILVHVHMYVSVHTNATCTGYSMLQINLSKCSFQRKITIEQSMQIQGGAFTPICCVLNTDIQIESHSTFINEWNETMHTV